MEKSVSQMEENVTKNWLRENGHCSAYLIFLSLYWCSWICLTSRVCNSI